MSENSLVPALKIHPSGDRQDDRATDRDRRRRFGRPRPPCGATAVASEGKKGQNFVIHLGYGYSNFFDIWFREFLV